MKPHLIVIEVNTEKDNIEFLQNIIRDAALSNIPLIALSFNRESDFHVYIIKSGVDIFLQKPIKLDVLEASIYSLLNKAKKQEEVIQRTSIFSNTESLQVTSTDEKLLKSVVDFVNKHITQTTITADEVCQYVGISHSNLYRKTKQLTGKSLNELIRYLRIVKAEKLRATGKFTVAEVMDQVGFTNHSYFAKSFKEQFNENPKNYSIKNR